MTDDAHFSSLTDVGRVRDHNEDTTAVVNPADPYDLVTKGVLGIVADGMGGHEAGEVASSRAVDAFVGAYYSKSEPEPSRALQIAVKAANDAVRSIQAVRAGTTLVAAAVVGDDAHLVNVGDSRAYLVTPDAIRQITRDHSWVQDQVAAGHLTQEQARVHPRRNVLTRCLGGDAYVQGDYYHEVMYEGCSIVLCSDGLHGMVSDKEIGEIVRRADPDRAALDLIALANRHGGHDNISVVILRKGGVEGLETGFKTVRADRPRFKALGWVLGGAALIVALVGFAIVLSGAGKAIVVRPTEATSTLTATPTVPPVGSGGTTKALADAVTAPLNATPRAVILSGNKTIVLSVPKNGVKNPTITLSSQAGDVIRPNIYITGSEIRDIQSVADGDHSVWVLTDLGLFRVSRVSSGPGVKVDPMPNMVTALKAHLRFVGTVHSANPYPVALSASDGLWRKFNKSDPSPEHPSGLWLLPEGITEPVSVKWIRGASNGGALNLVMLSDGGALYSSEQLAPELERSTQLMTKDQKLAPVAPFKAGSRLAARGDQSSVAVWSKDGDTIVLYRSIGGRLERSSPILIRNRGDKLIWMSGTSDGYVALTQSGTNVVVVKVPTPAGF